ncbi:MAG TPA: hypothetical protein VME42_20600 [Steroidobacteraceae bacterium]|nr:hypothetical protein [Steroidobacteraceae bacterium]
MKNTKRLAKRGFLLSLIVLAAACGEPHEGFYDREHHRWYHDHQWHECVEHDVHCG